MRYLFIILLFSPFFTICQVYPIIGNGTNSPEWHPFYGLYDYSQNMYIYDASEMGTEHTEIFEISFDLFGYGEGYEFNNLTIKMAHISEDYFPSNTTAELNHLNYTDLTTCVSSYGMIISNNGWNRIPFSSTFNYNGTDNVLIIVENHDGTWSPGYGATYCTYESLYKSWYKYRDDIFPVGSGSRDKYRPNLKFGGFTFTPLPITLSSFTAQFTNELDIPSVMVNWSTESEKDNEYFTLWRSIDGYNWSAIEKIAGAGNSTQTIYYNYLDYNIPNPIVSNQYIYYKLSQADTDGTNEFFDVISVETRIKKKNIIRFTNLMGQDVDDNHKGIVIQQWSNGEVSKTYKH